MFAEFHQALLDPDRAPPELIQAASDTERQQRFAVYRNNLFSSLSDALSQTYATVWQLVGQPFFHALACEYVRQNPPQSTALVNYGASFADFMRHQDNLAVPAYLPDVARVDWLCLQSANAADDPPVATEQLLELAQDPDRLAACRVRFVASVQLYSSPFAVASIWQAHQQPEPLPHLKEIVVTQQQQLLVSRVDYQVHLTLLDPASFAFLSALQQGHRIGEALALAEPFDLTATLKLLLDEQAIGQIGAVLT